MTRSEVVLAAMAAPGKSILFDPVRIQKLLFLIDQEAGSYINGPHFDFQPYLYGPFDSEVYDELSSLVRDGLVESRGPWPRTYCLTSAGQGSGAKILNSLPHGVARYFDDCARWVLSLSFGNLLSAIYQKYPEMAVNSVFPEVRIRFPYVLSRTPVPAFLNGVARTFDLGGVVDHYDPGNSGRRNRQQLHDAWRTVGNNLRSAMAGYRSALTDADAS